MCPKRHKEDKGPLIYYVLQLMQLHIQTDVGQGIAK